MARFRNSLLCCACAALFGCAGEVDAPAPFGAVPNAQQLRWQEMDYYMFVHFGPNTFTDVEWGDGKENPAVFNPTALDCRQWAETAKAAGMKGIIITAKHHDGFCLWPSAYSTHTVRQSPWKDGKGDVLRELSNACKACGIKFGVYLSPWDRNHPTYGTPDYNDVFVRMLTEVLTGYGDVFEQWFDGANGDERQGLKRQTYDWSLFNRTVRRLQPKAVIFSDVGPDCRWMGNENGVASATNWSTLNTAGFEPGIGAPAAEMLSTGNENGDCWVPAEADVSIRPGWFYSPATDTAVKSVAQLMDIYHTTIGRNANLLLNVPPNREGRIHPADSLRLMEFRRAVDSAFATDLLRGAKAGASNTRGNRNANFTPHTNRYAAANILDGNPNTYWATDDSILTASVTLTLAESTTFNCLVLREYIPLGQRISHFVVEVRSSPESRWQRVSEGTTIGNRRILRFAPVTACHLRLSIDSSLAPPLLRSLSLYNQCGTR